MIALAWLKLIPTWAYALVAIVALAGVGAIYERRVGEAITQTAWDADKAARVQADNAAILSRVKNNERVAEQQRLDNDNITKVHDDEISTVRAALAHSERLRIGAALCGGPAGATQTTGAGSGDAADPGSRLVREDVGRDLDALKLKMEETAATGRACQAFARVNGLTN